MKKLFLFLLLVLLSLASSAQINAELAIQLQDALENTVINQDNNGVSAHLIMPDGQTWTGTAGIDSQNMPITETTLFHGASTTKFNIALLALLLAEENLLDLDQSWTNFVSLDVDFDTSITVRQLLNHTSGIADYLETPTSGNNVTTDFNFFFSPQYILENIVNQNPLFPVGTSFQYSNSNYVLVGLIIETVTGNPVHVELRNRIWTPLSMDNTYFGAYDNYSENTAGVWWNFGNGIQNYSEIPTTSMLSFAYSAGNIVSCPTDLSILLSAVLNGQLINSESLNKMSTFVPQSYSSWTAGYGLGIHHFNGFQDDTLLGHDGYFSNLTDMFHSMNYGFTLVTMTNTQTEWLRIYKDLYEVLEVYFMTSSTDILKNKFNYSISPNPSNNQFQITSSENIEKVEIRDTMGKIIFTAIINANNYSFNLYKNGLYFVNIEMDSKIITEKIIVSSGI